MMPPNQSSSIELPPRWAVGLFGTVRERLLQPERGVGRWTLLGMNAPLSKMICVVLFLQCICSAQVSSTPPRNWTSAASIDFGLGFSQLKLSHNSPEAVRREILDTSTVRLIAKFSGLTDKDLATVQVAQESGSSWVQVYQLGRSERWFKVLSDQLRNYVRARQEGHTRAFLLAALTNRAEPSTISDPDLRAIVTNRALLPVSWLKKAEWGTMTNKAGKVASCTISISVVDGRTVTNETTHIPQVDEVCRWASYTLVDGEVAWRYFVRFKADGSLDYIHDTRYDAKEYDAKYQKVIKAAEDE